MAGGIHEAHESVQNLMGKDTSDYRVRAKTINPNTANEKVVYKVDSKLTQACVKVLSAIGIEKGSYLKDHEIKDHFKSKIDFQGIRHTNNNFGLAVIALKKELNTTNDPGSVLAKYHPDVRAALLITLEASRSSDGKLPAEAIKGAIQNKDENDVRETLLKKHREGTNFETGKQDLGQVTDRIMNSNTPLTDLDNYSPDLCGKLFLKSKGFGEANVDYARSTVPREDLKTMVKNGYDLKTGKKDLDGVAKRLIASSDPKKALESYSPDLKADLLKNANQNEHARYIMRTFSPKEASDDEKLATLAKFGISVHTGEIVDRQKFRKEITPYQWKEGTKLVSEQTPECKKMIFQKISQNEDMDYLMTTLTKVSVKNPDVVIDSKLKTLENMGIDVQTGKISNPEVLEFTLATHRSDTDPEKKLPANYVEDARKDVQAYLSLNKPEPGKLKNLFSGETTHIQEPANQQVSRRESLQSPVDVSAKEDLLKSLENNENAKFVLSTLPSDASVDEKLITLAQYGIDAQTGKINNPEKLALQLSNWRYDADPMDTSNTSDEALKNVKEFMKANTSVISKFVKSEPLKNLFFVERDATIPEDLEKASNHIMKNPKAIDFYSDNVKRALLAKIDGEANVQFVYTNIGPALHSSINLDSTDRKIKALIDCGIHIGTGEIADPDKLAYKLAEYRVEFPPPGNPSRELQEHLGPAKDAVKYFMTENEMLVANEMKQKSIATLFQ